MRILVGSLLTLPLAVACSTGLGLTPSPVVEDDGGGAAGATGQPAQESPPEQAVDTGPVFSQFVRLTHTQWENSVRAVLRLPEAPGLAQRFTQDPSEGTFSNNERALLVTPGLRVDYQLAAAELAAEVAQDAAQLARLDGFGEPAVFITELGRRVYRRALTGVEQSRYGSLFDTGATVFESGDAFADGARLVIEAMLQSPHFLYRQELGDPGEPLRGSELAAKLSFLLLDTTPDDALLDAAEAGELDTSEGLMTRARQMLELPEAEPVVARFHAELFGLDRYSAIAKDPERFPQHTAALNAELRRAEELFLTDLFERGGGLRQILTSTWGFVNTATAPLYGTEVRSEDLVAIDLGPERPGLFTRVGFLAYNGTLRDPDAIHRGVEINRVALCAKMQPPPGVVPALPILQAGQTNRERITAHTGPDTCGERCHGTIINPVGFALENFDALGQSREMDNGKPVDTSGEYRFTEGIEGFSGARELMQLIAESPQAHACFAEHVMEFGLGRSLDEGDAALREQLQALSLTGSRATKELLVSVIGSPLFRNRVDPASRGGAR